MWKQTHKTMEDVDNLNAEEIPLVPMQQPHRQLHQPPQQTLKLQPRSSHNVDSKHKLAPLCEPFTDKELSNVLIELLQHIQDISKGAPDEEALNAIHLDDYITTIDARSSDSGYAKHDRYTVL
jgi:hypothetical protein